jgi:glycosyltransferase involved in cell wall biosynthesis
MISIVICSRTPVIAEALQNNIESSIGCAHEIIVVDNSQNEYSIFSAYNKGVELSQYAIICFMHDDIVFHTQNWGNKVVEKFQDEKLGAIGVAGSPYYPLLAGPWWSGGLVTKNIVQNASLHKLSYATPINGQLPVLVLDGVWICIRKTLFSKIRFDDKLLKGFHLYDVDISLQVHAQGYELASVYDIVIEHASRGVMNNNWMENCLAVQKKWANHLPLTVIPVSYAQEIKYDYRALQEFMEVQGKNGISKMQSLQFAMQQILTYRLPRFKIQFLIIILVLVMRHALKKLGIRE